MDQIQSLLDYLNAAPECYQSVRWWRCRLEEAGAVQLRPGDAWALEPGRLYYAIVDGTQLTAFRMGTEDPVQSGLRIMAAHHDSPGFKLKPAMAAFSQGMESATVEPYGGLILRGWFDRPLGLAGRVCVNRDNRIESVDICLKEPLMIIPSLAIHQGRDVNDTAVVSRQHDMRPITGQQAGALAARIAEAVCAEPEQILSVDLTLFDIMPACTLGVNREFISASGLDDRAMAHAAMTALLSTASPYTAICALFDHEEIGSQSDRGMRGQGLIQVVDRICHALGKNEEEKRRMLSRSAALSADMAHATHPVHGEKADADHRVQINAGPVLKVASSQSYATSPLGSALFRQVCRQAQVPCQWYVNHNDVRGGGTIGGMLASQLGVVTADIGNPMLGMHSVRELAGCQDHEAMIGVFSAFIMTDLEAMGCYDA